MICANSPKIRDYCSLFKSLQTESMMLVLVFIWFSLGATRVTIPGIVHVYTSQSCHNVDVYILNLYII